MSQPGQGHEGSGGPRIPRLWPFKHVYYGWAIVGAAFIVGFGQVPVFGPVIGVFIKPIEEELGWSRATIALGFTLGSMTGSLTTFLVGRFLDRHGARVIVAVAGIVITLALLGMSFMQAPWHFWVLFGLGRGSALAGIQVGTSIAVANWFIRKRGRAMGIRGIGQRSGQALVPLLILSVMVVADWRTAFLVLAGLAALTIVAPAALVLRRRPEDLGLLPDGAAPEESAESGGRGTRESSGGEVSWTLAEARRTRAFWMIVLFMTTDRFAMGSINLHMVANFQDKELPAAVAVGVLSLFAATSAVTVVPWGFLLERIHVRYGAMMMLAMLVMSMFILMVADNIVLALAFGLLFGLATGASTVVEPMLLPDYFGRRSVGAMRGFAAPLRVASPLGPVFAGWLYDTTGSYTIAFGIFAAIFAVLFVAMLLATPPRKPEAVTVADKPSRGEAG